MLYTGSCRKQDLMEEIVNVISNDGNFNMISSNAQTDFLTTAVASDGYVFKSNFVGEGDNITFALKDVGCGQTNTSSDMRMMYGSGYTPSTSPLTNGVWLQKSPWKTWYVTKNGPLSFDTQIKYWIDILPHRILIITQKDHYGYEFPSLLHIGYPELHSQVTTHLMDNITIAGSNLNPLASNNNTTVEVQKDANGNLYQPQSLSALLPATNPNVAGEYQLSPIYIGNANTGFIGKIEGLWLLPMMNINNNDEIEVNGSRYKVFNITNQHGYTSFVGLSQMVAIKVV